MTAASEGWIIEFAKPLRRRLEACPDAPLPLPAIPRALEAVLLLGLATGANRSFIWIGDGSNAVHLMARNLRTLDHNQAATVLTYPVGGRDADGLSSVFAARDRLSVLSALASMPERPLLALTCIEAVLQTCPTPEALRQSHRIIETGMEWERDDLTAFLEKTGHRFVHEVYEPGQAAVRGGILDIWPIRETHPFRVDFFGPTVESIRIFDPADQRSIAARSALHIGLATEERAPADGASGRFIDYWPATAAIVWSRHAEIKRHLQLLRESGSIILDTAMPETAIADPLPEPAASGSGERTGPGRASRPHIYMPAPESMSPDKHLLPDDIRFLEGVTAPSDDEFQPDSADRQRLAFVERLAAAAGRGVDVRIYFNTAGSLKHFRDTYASRLTGTSVKCVSGWLSDGFYLPGISRMLVSEDLIYGRGKRRRLRTATSGQAADNQVADAGGRRLSDWNELNAGDLVVHMQHGIGRYLGLETVNEGSSAGEYLIVAYANAARLFVPVSQIHLLSRYVGAARQNVRLHFLGGNRWSREKHAAERAIEDLAASFVELQAARQTLGGHAFKADTPWMHDFENAFPFEETIDQAQAIADVLRDMESERPMDRLICGDAGYGKTEVAMRAAFKAVMDGKQVAVFVPTTVLAQQHYYTFIERMGPYPIALDMLSRFSSTADRRRVHAGLSSGTIDIVIGTHALLNKSISFRDLGLVVIDEEQRFGVMHKERFKHIRRMVDVLTMTATPIPRTLYLSLTGVRELSSIRTPPRDRLAIETEIAEDRDEAIRHAILRELSRDGQVFFLHNRVQSIDGMLTRLQRLTPEARIEIAHGQMAARTLSEKMRRFAAGRFDVLLCTTIIESGVDIPAANTMIVNRADRFGLAELYQLRGRVGRSGVRAHALMLLPRHGLADPSVHKRVGALKEYSHPGAGFELALRDLEIRGAGNLLGSEQSGHIAAVGFNLYCQFLQRTIAQLKGEQPPVMVDVALQLDFMRASGAGAPATASLPADYVTDKHERMRLYRRIAEATQTQTIADLEAELRDRFGALPLPAKRLMAIAEIRIAAATKGMQSIETEGAKLMIRRDGEFIRPNGRFPRLAAASIDERLPEIRHLIDWL